MASINDLATAAVSALGPEAEDTATPSSTAAAAAGEGAEHRRRQNNPPSAAPPARGPPSSSPSIPSEPVPAHAPNVTRGALVILEGLDRSGKTTQVKLLEQRFVELGKRVKVMRFPDRTTPIGQMIDSYLRSQVEMDDHVIHLLFSANRWEAAKTITSLIAGGTTVICDRYYHSGIVYSAAKQNPSLSLDWARAPEVGLPRPDLVLFLDLDEDQAKARGGWGGELYEKAEMQRRVRKLFWGLSAEGTDGGASSLSSAAAAGSNGADDETGEEARPRQRRALPGHPGKAGGTEASTVEDVGVLKQEKGDLRVIDASPSVEEVAEEIWKVVRPRVAAVEGGEVERSVRKVI